MGRHRKVRRLPQVDQRFQRSLLRRSDAELLEAAGKIESALTDERVGVMLEYAMLYVDRWWQAGTPEAFRFYQGMAQIVSMLESLPARIRNERKATATKAVSTPAQEIGLESVKAGQKYFTAVNR